MSYILDSIKKAERERKLGQEAPSISIEYAGEHVSNNNGVNSLQWAWMLFGLIVAAILVWGVTNYFSNRDQQYVQHITESQDVQLASQGAGGSNAFIEKQNIEIVPVEKVHQSDLKTVKVISEEEKQYEPIKYVIPVPDNAQKSIVAERPTPEPIVETTQVKNKLKIATKFFEKEPTIIKQKDPVSAKQDLVAIYSDLIKTKPNVQAEPSNAIHQKPEQIPKDIIVIDEELVELNPASYVVPDTTPDTNVVVEQHTQLSHVVDKKALDTGLPSIGELPYVVQEKMPPFNVSVHMFHADPEQRRMRINSNMYTEGKQLQQDLKLVEITRYGAVFDFQGNLFRLNVR